MLFFYAQKKCTNLKQFMHFKMIFVFKSLEIEIQTEDNLIIKICIEAILTTDHII